VSPEPDAAITLRPLAAADGPACDAIILSLPYHFGDEGGREMCAKAVRGSRGLVALVDGEVAGFLTVQPHCPESAEITWMAVHARHRRRGIGRRLIARLADELRAEGRALLLVMTAAEDEDEAGVADSYTGTRAFYQSQGFIPARELPDYWPGNVALLLVRPLG
jgi:ribosomal protein S18 acetylase RimI-like enzyme